MVSLLVDTVSFVEAGSVAGSVARSVDRAMSTAASGLGRLSHMAGSDPNGLKWAASYDAAAGQIFSYATQLQNGCASLARNLAVTGYFYEVAEISNAGGTAAGLAFPAPITETGCLAVASAAGGQRTFPNPNPAFEWIAEQIANLVGDMWPDGDTDKLNQASTVWHHLADDLDDVASGLKSVIHALAAVDTPELPRIHDAVSQVRTFAKKLATAARHLGTACNTLSGQIAHVHMQTEITVGITTGAIAVTVGAALGLTVFTFGISDAVGVAGVAGETAGAVATITGFIAELAASISTAVGGIVASTAGLVGLDAGIATVIGTTVGDITASAVLWGFAGAGEDMVITGITQPGDNLADAAEQGFISGAIGGGIGGAFGKTFELIGGAGVPSINNVTTSLENTTAAIDLDDRVALSDYTNSGYSDMNYALRGGMTMDADLTARADAVSTALSKLPDHPGMAYRGTDLTSDQIASYLPGTIREDPAFLSASIDETKSFNGNTLFIIDSVHGKDVSPFSIHDEAEVLFDKGTSFEVTANFIDSASGRHIIIMGETR
ncbi:MAG: ADP-ribosyltransferase [Pseudolysinimonas sp.]